MAGGPRDLRENISDLPNSAFDKAVQDNQRLYVTGVPGQRARFGSITENMQRRSVMNADHVTATQVGKPGKFYPAVTGVTHYEGTELARLGVLATHQNQATAKALAHGKAFHAWCAGFTPHFPVGKVFITQSVAPAAVTMFHLRAPDLRVMKMKRHRVPTVSEMKDYVNGLLALFKSKEDQLQAIVRKTDAEGGMTIEALRANADLTTIDVPLQGAGMFDWNPKTAMELTTIAWLKFCEEHGAGDRLLASHEIVNDRKEAFLGMQAALTDEANQLGGQFNWRAALARHLPDPEDQVALNYHGSAYSLDGLQQRLRAYDGSHKVQTTALADAVAAGLYLDAPLFGVDFGTVRHPEDIAAATPEALGARKSRSACLFAGAEECRQHAVLMTRDVRQTPAAV